MNPPTRPQIVRVIAALTFLATMAAGFDILGVLAATLTIAVLATLPPVYGFAVGQLALAILAPHSPDAFLASPTSIGAELGLILALWSNLTTPTDRTLIPAVITLTLLLAATAAISVGETQSLWQAGGVLLTALVLLAYALHRYTVVAVLEEATR